MFIIKGIRNLWNKKEMLWVLSQNDFKKRFVGSFFGIVWMFVQPVVSVFIYYLIFQLGFKSNPVDNFPYVLWLLPGIVPWFFFNEAVMTGVGCLTGYQHLVKKMSFPVEIIPLIKVVSATFVHLIFFVIMIAIYLLYGYAPKLWWIQSGYYLICNLILITGIVYLTSAMNVFVKDTNQVVNIFLQFGFWLAPIMWDEAIMPAAMRPMLKLNPFTYIVHGYRDCFIFDVPFWENWQYAVYFWVVTMAIFILGAFVFKKMKPQFVDVL